jgi:hypothetical protein
MDVCLALVAHCLPQLVLATKVGFESVSMLQDGLKRRESCHSNTLEMRTVMANQLETDCATRVSHLDGKVQRHRCPEVLKSAGEH